MKTKHGKTIVCVWGDLILLTMTRLACVTENSLDLEIIFLCFYMENRGGGGATFTIFIYFIYVKHNLPYPMVVLVSGFSYALKLVAFVVMNS